MKHRTCYLAVLGCLATFLPAHAADPAQPVKANAMDAEADAAPLTGPAWTAADLAYKAYAQGDYAAALRHVKIALTLRPDLARLHALQGYAEQAMRRRIQPKALSAVPASTPYTADVALLKKLDALQASESYEVALALAEQGLRAPGQHTALAARARELHRQAAMQVAASALRADANGDAAAALAAIRTAPAIDPDAPQYRLLLIDLLNRNQDATGAYKAAQLALAIHGDDALTQTYTAFLLQQRGDWAGAQPLYQTALASDELGDADLRNLRLIVADAALAAGDAGAAMKALTPLPEGDIDARERRALVRYLAAGNTRYRPELNAPQLRCILNRFGPVCSLFAGARPSQRMAAASYRAQNDGKRDLALGLIGDAMLVGGATTELAAQRKQVLGIMGREQAGIAFKAINAGNTAAAQQALQRAITFAPEVMAYRIMIINMAVEQKDYAGAERLAIEAIRIDDGDIAPLVMRGYVRQAQGHLPAARADYMAALGNQDLAGADRTSASLYVADALTAGGDAAAAARVLDKLPADDPQVHWRRRLFETGGQRPALAAPGLDYRAMPYERPPLTAPGLDYRATPYDTVVAIKPSPYAADALVSAIFHAMAAHDNDVAVSLARELAGSAPDNANYQRVLAIALTEAGATPEAGQIKTKLGGAPDLEFAYMAQRVAAPQLAADTFKEIDQAGALPDRALQDAGYAALGANERPAAGNYFKRAIDASHDGRFALGDEQLFTVRRTVEQLERQWGGYIGLNYRGASPQSGPAGATASDSAQLGAEGYWRPPQFNRDGRYVDLYARVTANVYSRESGIATGAGSTLGALGVRVKPLASQNLILAAERLVPLGDNTDSDWLLRAAYSAGTGTDLRARAGQWTMAQVYAEAGRYLSAGTNYFTSEAQLGRSFLRTDGGHTVWTPYLVLGADYNEGFVQREAIGAGVGVSWRYWFNEDRYTAPRAYFDVNLQYRARISGDDRAGGVVLRAILTR
jgi:tetratricopeptide (TPR) repeat protein